MTYREMFPDAYGELRTRHSLGFSEKRETWQCKGCPMSCRISLHPKQYGYGDWPPQYCVTHIHTVEKVEWEKQS